MRKSKPLTALFPAIRQEVLSTLLMHDDRAWYLSDIAKHIGVRPSSLQRELASLAEAGILSVNREGNRVYYRADKSCPFFGELRALIEKTSGLVYVLQDFLAPLKKKISCAFVYGSIARAEENTDSDIDLLVVGEVGLSDLALKIRNAETRLGRPINPTVYSVSEFAKKVKAGQHFATNVLNSTKLFVIGDEHELEKASGRQQG